MQAWANTDSNDLFFHAFTKGEDGLRAMCNKRIRPAERHRRRDVGLFTEDEVRRLPFPTIHLCERCTAKTATPAKTTAPALAAQDGEAPLYVRAEVRHAAVGKGRRVHYSPSNDDTLCGRIVSAYLDVDEAAERFGRGDELCTRCVAAAEERAYGISLGASSQLSRAAAGFGATVEAAEENGRAFVVDEEALDHFADVTPDARPSLGEALVITRADRVRFGDTVFGCLPDREGAPAATLGHVIMHSDPYTAAPRPYDSACGCLGCAQAAPLSGPVITLATETPWETCDPIPAASLVLIREGRRTAGSAPRDADNPDALAALAVLDSLSLATVTDEHDFTGADEFDGQAHGALVEPRGAGRVAVYWLAEGLYVAGEERAPHRAELRIIADRLSGAGWRIEPGSVRCVFAWRPSAEA
ncbi:hypothetical protein [Streptomyces sp. B21-083]|uniref:hypothetical protein n=1 Tax=Streptomyces sp. B21-083 TaxID=3039410 RepID=UPI002FEE6BA7